MHKFMGLIMLAGSLALSGCGTKKEVPIDHTEMQPNAPILQTIRIIVEKGELVGSNLELISTAGGKYSCDIFLVKAVYVPAEKLPNTDAVITINKRSLNDPGTVAGIVIHAENQQVADYWTKILELQETELSHPHKN